MSNDEEFLPEEVSDRDEDGSVDSDDSELDPGPGPNPSIISQAGSDQRKTQFRWNAQRDLKLVSEVGAAKPFLKGRGQHSQQAWGAVADAVNDLFGGDIDYFAASRRFQRLFSDFREKGAEFRKRYRPGYNDEEDISSIVEMMKTLELMIGGSNEQAKDGLPEDVSPPESLSRVRDPNSSAVPVPESESEPRCRKRGRDGRRIQFRWNARRDLTLVREAALAQPFMEKGRAATQAWEKVVNVVNKVHGADIDYLAVRRRFLLLLGDFKNPDFAKRYRSGNDEEEVSAILSTLHAVELIMNGKADAKLMLTNILQNSAESYFGQDIEASEMDSDPLSENVPECYPHPPSEMREPCLICSYTDIECPELYNFSGSNGFPPLNRQLWHTFVLRKLLKLPGQKFEKILKKAGSRSDPSDWFDICGACTMNVNQILEMQAEIKILEGKVSKLKKVIREKCNENTVGCANSSRRDLSVRDQIRRFLKFPVAKASFATSPEFKVEPKEENFATFHESSVADLDEDKDMLTEDNPVNSDNENDSEENFEEFGNIKEPVSDEEWAPDSSGSKNSIVPVDPLQLDDAKEDEDPSDEGFEPISKRKRSLQTSRKLLKGNGLFKCDICPQKYSKKHQYTKHTKFDRRCKKVYKGAFDCHKCRVPFSSKPQIQSHLRRRHDMVLHNSWDVTLPQEEYTYTSQTKSELLARLSNSREKKTLDQAYECQLCPRKYCSQKFLETHTKVHESSKRLHDGKLDCYECKAPFLNVKTLRVHLKNIHQLVLDEKWDGKTPQEHSIKARRSGKAHGAEDGETENAPEDRKCKRCGAGFRSKKMYEDHLKVHETTPDDLHCPKSHRPYPGRGALTRHLRQVHETVDANSVCELCAFEAGSAAKLKPHVIKHKIFDGSVDPSVSTTHFICTICKETFDTRKKLSNHRIGLHHEELGIEVLKCTVENCPKVFLRRSYLLEHVADKHERSYKYQCEECGYGAVTKFRLESHMLKHKNTKQKMCEYCSATYTHRSGFKSHMVKVHPDKYQPRRRNNFYGVEVQKLEKEYGHGALPMGTTGTAEPEKQFPCKYCDAIFPHKFGFNNHLSTAHKDMYQFNCDLCERVYMSLQSLKLHKKLNHGGNTKATCGWCFQSYNHRLNLYSHRKYCKKKPKGADVPKILALEDNPKGRAAEVADNS